jgi:HSP20 family protein
MDENTKALQAKEKAEVTSSAEQTKPGPTFTPAVDIFETDEALTLVADMPGVEPEDLSIDLHENMLTLSGGVAPPESAEEGDIYREYRTGQYVREFSLGRMIDQSKIEAELSDGVLRLTLPKSEAATPRKITVKAG